MTAGALIILAFVSSLGALVAAMFRSGTRDILIAIAAFYIFWAFGPVINYLVGVPIYFGTVESQIAQASIIFFLGTMGILLPAIITSSKNEQGKTTALRKAHSLSILALIEVVLILWFVLRLPGLLSHHGSMNKVDFVSHFRTQHYSYLMIQIYVTAFFFQARGTLLQRWLYNSNFISYVLYCLLTWERDFIFPLFSIFLHVNVLRGGTFWGVAKIGSIAAAAASLGTWLFLVRGDHAVGELGISILNQGSLLFVNTYFLQLLEEGVGPFYGFTYWNALLNLFPHWIVSTDFNTLSWFHAQYAPRGESGYGFGLDAEAYLNFGVSGVVCVFLVLGSFQRFVFNRIGKSSFYLYFSVFFTGFLMYSLRNDSLALIKGSIYAILFFWLIIIASVVLRRVGRRREWSLQFETGDRLQSQDT